MRSFRSESSRLFRQTAGRRLRSRDSTEGLSRFHYHHQRRQYRAGHSVSCHSGASVAVPSATFRSQPLISNSFKFTWNNQPHRLGFLRGLSCQFSTSSLDDDDPKRENGPRISKGKSELSADLPGPLGKLVVTPTPHGGFKVELLIPPRLHRRPRQQYRYLSSKSTHVDIKKDRTGAASSKASAEKSSAGAKEPEAQKESAKDELVSKETRLRERRRRVAVYYPYNDKDIRRKQAKRKEKARAQTVANVNRALMGNVIIAGSKLFAWFCSQSSSMMSEFIHSVVDCANQYLLLQGLKASSNEADRKHPYGYGKSVYFWALVSALGTFFMGFGISMTHAVGELMAPSLHEIGPEVWGVLTFSFLVDGYVLLKTIKEVRGEVPEGRSFLSYVKGMRDPATLAILLEDGAACFGVLLAIAGTSLAHSTGNPMFDGMAGVSISVLLGTMGFILAKVNHRFLLGTAVDKEITDGIEKILKSRKSIDAVHSVQSQWTGPDTFSYKAEVGFDGTFLAAKLMPTHEKEFLAIRDSMSKELPVVLSWYAEDVIRTVEREVQIIESLVRKQYPAAEFIELEPMSKDFDQYAIDDSFEKDLRRMESENLDKLRRLIPSLDQFDVEGKSGTAPSEDPLKKPTK